MGMLISRKWRVRATSLRRGALYVTVALALASHGVLSIQPAYSDTKQATDSVDDADGGLDISVLMHRHGTHGSVRVLQHRLTTEEAWDSSVLADEFTAISFSFYFDYEFRREILVDVSPDGTLFAEVRNERHKVIGFAKVWRPDDRAVQIEFPKRTLRRGLRRYTWEASTSYHSTDHETCGGEGDSTRICGDSMPEPRQKRILHRLN